MVFRVIVGTQVLLLNVNHDRLHVVDVVQLVFHRFLHGHDLIQRDSIIDRQLDNRMSDREALIQSHTSEDLPSALKRSQSECDWPPLLGAPFPTLP